MSPDVLSVMRGYPRIYFACHVEHRTRDRSVRGLTGREAGLLAHVTDPAGTGAGDLARHLGLAASTLSAALGRLEGLGLIRLEADEGDARRRIVRLTDEGRAAVVEDSVLDAGRVERLLATLDEEERGRAVSGLALLAEAADRLRRAEGGA